jgi:pimeloyl-ACP methyl ester carboxylesterase
VPHADSHGTKIWYDARGDGVPLILIPGFGTNATVYWANAPVLARHFRTIVMDPRGSGRSDTPDPPYTMEQFADDVAAVLDAAGVDSAHVFGTSFGGMVAQHVALRHPARVRRLVLGCTTAGGTRHVMPQMEHLGLLLASGDIPDAVDALRSLYPVNYSDAFAAQNDARLCEVARTNAHLRSAPAGREGQTAAATAHDTYDRLHAISVPTLVLHGEDDRIVPVANGRLIADSISGARLVVYPEARHIFFVECADAVNTEIAAFLAGADEEVAA